MRIYISGPITNVLDYKENYEMISSEKIKRRRLSARERNYFYKMYGGRCAYCGTHITFRGMQIDHKIP